MASNQVSNQRHGANSGRSPKSGPEASGRDSGGRTTQSTGQGSSTSGNVAHEPERNWGSLEGVRDQAADYWTRGEDQMRELVRDREGTAIMIALAAGLGVGLVLGASIGATPRPRTWRERVMAEGFGRRIMDRIENMVPEALTEHFSR